MEGKEVRFGIANSALWATATTAASNGSVNSMHDSFTPMGGLVPDVADPARRGRLRRRRLGPLRDARLRDHRGLRGGPDGGPYARVPRQEDRGLRDEDGLPGHPHAARGRPHRDGGGGRRRRAARRASPIPARTASARSSTRSPPRGTTTAAPSRAFPRTRPSTTPRWASPCCSRATGWPFPTLAIAGALAAKKTVPRGPGTLPTHTPLFVVLLVGVVVLVGALTFVPALALGPIVEHLMLIASGEWTHPWPAR